MTKPVAAFIAGQTAPPGQAHGPRRRDHLRRQGPAAEKIAALQAAGIAVAKTPAEMGKTSKSVLDNAPVGALGRHERKAIERTFSIVKPDAVARNNIGAIIRTSSTGGLRPSR